MGRSPIPLLKIVSRKKKLAYSRITENSKDRFTFTEKGPHTGRMSGHPRGQQAIKMTINYANVMKAIKRRKHFFDVRSYIYRRDSWAIICQFTDFLTLPVCVEPYIIIVTRKWCDTWLCTMSVDGVCARLVLVPHGSKAAAWKLVLSPQSASRSRGKSLVVRLLHPVYL